MSNFYFPEHDCVLIHIPKTGGTSIRKGVFRGNYVGPFFGHVPDEYAHCFKFAFARNPFDRLISAWKMFASGTEQHTSGQRPAAHESLEGFLDIVMNEDIIYDERRSTTEEKIRHHTIPQTHPFNCLHCADFIGRFENLQNDFDTICSRLGIATMTLPKMNITDRKHYREYYSARTIETVLSYYRDDFELFGYAF